MTRFFNGWYDDDARVTFEAPSLIAPASQVPICTYFLKVPHNYSGLP